MLLTQRAEARSTKDRTKFLNPYRLRKVPQLDLLLRVSPV